MTFKTHCQMSKGMVDAAPLVNVVFLLLLFFVLNSSLVMQSGFGVSLPAAGMTPLTGNFQTLVVTAARDDLLFFNDQPISIDKLEQALREAVQQTRVRESDHQGRQAGLHRNRDRDHERRESGGHYDG